MPFEPHSDCATWRRESQARFRGLAKDRCEGLAFFPIRRNLQNSRAAQAAMRNQHLLAKLLPRNSSEIAIAAAVFFGEEKWHQSGPGRNNLQPELLCQFVAERGRTHFGDREASSGNNQRRRTKFAGIRFDYKFSCASNFPDLLPNEYLRMRRLAFRLQKIGDVLCRAVAKKLAQRFFVIGDTVVLYPGDEILGCVAGERRFCEVFIRRNKILRFAMKISEVAAAAAGNENLFADAFRMLKDGHAAPTLASFDGAHQPRGTAPEYQNIKLATQMRPRLRGDGASAQFLLS